MKVNFPGIIIVALLINLSVTLGAQSSKATPDSGITTSAMNTDLVTLLVKVAAKPSSEAKAKKALQQDVQGAWSEAGNYKMELYNDRKLTADFYLVERWESRAMLEAHFNKEYTKAAFALANGDLRLPIEMNYLTELWPDERQRIKVVHHPRVTLIVRFITKGGQENRIVELFKSFVPLVRKEQGNMDFHFHTVEGNKSEFILYERWENQSALDAHNLLDSTKKIVSDLKEVLAAPIQTMIIQADDISN